MAEEAQNQLAILRLRQVVALTTLAKSTIYDRLDPKSPRHDPTFPRPIDLGGPGSRAVGFIRGEVEAWLADQIKKSRRGA